MSDVIGAAEVIADLEGAARRAGPVSDVITRGAAQRIEDRTRSTVKKRTGRTQASVGTTRNGAADYSVGGGQDGSLRRLELGGARGGAQPSLFPAADAEAPELSDQLARFLDTL